MAPRRDGTFKFSTDPELVAKVVDVVGLYLAPPENAVVLCVTERSWMQAPERTARGLRPAPRSSREPTDQFKDGPLEAFRLPSTPEREYSTLLPEPHGARSVKAGAQFLAFPAANPHNLPGGQYEHSG